MDIRSTESVKNHSIAPTVSGHSSDNIYCDMWARIRIPFLSSSLSYCSIHAWRRWQRRRMKCVVDTRVISCIFNMRMPPFFHFWSMASSLSANSELFRRKKKSHVCGATLYFSFCRRQSFLLLCLSFFFSSSSVRVNVLVVCLFFFVPVRNVQKSNSRLIVGHITIQKAG